MTLAPRPDLESIQNRRLYNSDRPISKLNDDILSHIFMINTQLDFDHLHIPSVTVRRSSQVIKKWRDLLLGYPMIWAASLDFADPLAWIHEILSRAGTSPINLVFPPITDGAMADKTIQSTWRLTRPSLLSLLDRWKSPTGDNKMRLALSLTSRARHITTLSYPGNWDHLLRNITRPSPNLNTFSLLLQSSYGTFGHDWKLPANIFGGLAPNLRTLNLHGCSCDFRSPIFRHLTALSVINLYQSQRRTVPEWLQILGGMPELVKLELEKSFRQDFEQSIVNLPPITFKLQSVVLKGDFIPCSLLLAHLQFPPSCEMVVEYWETEFNEHYHAMIADVQRKLKASGDVRKEYGLSVSLNWNGLGFSNFHHTLENKIVSFHWFTRLYIDLMEILSPFFAILQTAYSDITDLYLDMGSFEKSCIVECLLLFNKVNHLRIASNTSFEHIFRVLNNLNAEDPDIRLLPSLTKLMFYRLSFEVEGESSSFQSVLDFLYSRSNMELPIESIKFTHCCGVRRRVVELEVLGIDVEWDGVDEE